MGNIFMYVNKHKIDFKWVEIESQFLKRRKKSRFMKTFCLTCPAGAVLLKMAWMTEKSPMVA